MQSDPGWSNALNETKSSSLLVSLSEGQASEGLARLGRAAKEWLPLLHQVLDREIKASPDSGLGFSSAWAIAQIDSGDTECLAVLRDAGDQFRGRRILWKQIESVLGQRAPALVKIEKVLPELRDPQFVLDNPWDVSDFEWTWMVLRPHHEAVVPVLIQHLQSDRIDVRIAVARILGHLHVSPDVVVPAVADLLDDRYATVRAVAAESLAEFGPAAAAAIPALERATHDEFLTVKLTAQDALTAIRQTPFE